MATKTLRISQLYLPLQHTTEDIFHKACKAAGISKNVAGPMRLVRKSVDARKKEDVHFSYTVELEVPAKVKYKKGGKVEEITPVLYAPKAEGKEKITDPIVVIGAGPAGLFCAYLLAKCGLRPLLLERGKAVLERQADVERFWETGILDPNSNVQFGEGGAGTFSDGKLNTMVKDPVGRNRFVLETLVSFGAAEEILYESKPHVGTDVLCTVVKRMREEILRLGGQVRFSARVTDFCFKDGRLSSLMINDDEELRVSAAVLATGHSARDTFEKLYEKAVDMSPKAFAVGFRVEHPQEMIDVSQYGKIADRTLLPPAPYKLTFHAANGRSVYSFCMCPGGYVVNASSEEGRLAVNGMSYAARDGQNANSAILVSVTPADFPSNHPLAGMAFQRRLEERAFQAGGGKIPMQRLGDFASALQQGGEETYLFPQTNRKIESCTKGSTVSADLSGILPRACSEAFLEGMAAFGKKIKGFDAAETILLAVESRTSSPVRIHRDESCQANLKGLYPCGEGAGYAGGIVSAAMDGLRVAEALLKVYATDGQ